MPDIWWEKKEVLQHLVSALHDVEVTLHGSFVLRFPVSTALVTKQSCVIYL